MRPILLSELDMAARSLLVVDASARPGKMARILRSAGEAERHLALTGRYHPDHGNGSLASAARSHGIASARAVCDADYLAALTCVLQALGATNGDQSASAP